jgi:energy-converting hydrogenase Eha subunit A
VFFYEPGVLEEGVAGVMEGEPVTMGTALLSAAMVALPLALAAVTLFLPARASAITNLVVGVPLGAFGLFAIVSHLAEGAWHAHLTLATLAAAIAWLIVGLSMAGLRRLRHGDAGRLR